MVSGDNFIKIISERDFLDFIWLFEINQLILHLLYDTIECLGNADAPLGGRAVPNVPL